jgi:prepilin-type N-terminal cleavage/methylation domain-containing protein
MKNNSNLRAFSLIEISIVVLIIGILVAGVTQSSRLILQSKLSNAKTLTQSSPVASIKNLALWIEATSTASFDSSADNALTISNWYDINPQNPNKANFTTGVSPTYYSNIINGLPAVKFDGATTYLTSANFSNISSASASVFLVVKLPSTLAAQSVFSNRPSAAFGASAPNIQVSTSSTSTTGWQYCDAAAIVTSGTNCNYSASSVSIATSSSYIVSIIYTANSVSGAGTTTSTGYNFFQNGAGAGYGATTSSPNTSVTSGLMVVGKDGTTAPSYFGGYLGELVIFDRALKKEERQSVESYLGQKWGISMTVANY